MTARLKLMLRAARESKLYVWKIAGSPIGFEWVAAKYAAKTLVTLAAGVGATPLDAIRNLKFNPHIGELSATR